MRRGIVFLLLGLAGVAQERVRPPGDLPCSRDELTSYAGRVTAYSRTDQRITMTLHTDSDTTESFKLRLPIKMRLGGKDFRPEDWAVLEIEKGKLKPGVRATVWECKGGDRQIDWQSPRE